MGSRNSANPDHASKAKNPYPEIIEEEKALWKSNSPRTMRAAQAKLQQNAGELVSHTHNSSRDSTHEGINSSLNPESETTPLLSASRGPQNGDEEDDEGRELDFKAPVIIYFLFFICGLCTFAQTEAILMQLELYSHCLHFGTNFYAMASLCLFLPGLLIQVVHNKFDQKLDKRFGVRKSSRIRISISILGACLVIITFIALVHSNPDHHATNFNAVVYLMLCFVGMSTSISFSTFSTTLALFPEKVHPFFMVGTFFPFLVYAPANLALGALCQEKDFAASIYRVHWTAVLTYYFLAVMLLLAGYIAFLWITNHPMGYRLLQLKDRERNKYLETVAERIVEDVPQSNGVNTTPSVGHSERSYATIPSEHTSQNTQLAKEIAHAHKWRNVFRKVRIQFLAMFLVTFGSILVASQYVKLGGAYIRNLPTFLIYDYYMSQSAGIFLSFRKAFRGVNKFILLGIAVVRACFVPVVLIYARTNDIAMQNDFEVLFINSIFMMSGGFVYSSSFSSATARFDKSNTRTRSAMILSLAYYLSVCGAVLLSFVFS